MNSPTEVLRQVYGHETFRGQQREVIENVLQKRHTMALMPTGSGKSLCFQIPARLMGGTTVVLSPLIALMKDQVDQAKALGFRAEFINSSLSRGERERRYRRLAEGAYELLYVTPERFLKEDFRESLGGVNVPLLAVDEAHCISEWGHDFRPDFTRVPEFRELLGDPTMLFLTATATAAVREDIVRQSGLTPAEVTVFSDGLSRPNLSFEVREVHGLEDKVRAFVGLTHQYPGPAIVYFSLIATLEKFAREIMRLGLKFGVYHGQMPAEARRRSQGGFLSGDTALMLATPAFGLGINKADLRLIVHGEVPGSLEAYYQEAGRAGRDGLPSRCVLLYDGDDVSIQEEFIKWAHPEPEFIRNVHALIAENPLRVRQEGLDFLRERMNFYNRRDFRVETSVNLLKRWGFLKENDENDFTVEAELRGDLLDPAKNSERIRRDRTRLLAMVRYATVEVCRVRQIHDYFGDTNRPPCGHCDVCLL